ncbi:MAG: 4-alpha-glucanotransferase, partial [Candidatus Dormibacteria bacterium]
MSRPEFAVQATFGDAWGKATAANPDTVRALREMLGAADAGPRLDPNQEAVATCHLPRAGHTWGWATQLYAARSRRSWGHGDLEDLRKLASWSRGLGAGFVQLNPLHAGAPVGVQQASPYFPSSRRFRNPLYIAVDRVPGFRRVASSIAPVLAEAAALNRRRLLDPTRVYALKLRALEGIWAATPPLTGFDSWLLREGEDLSTYATYCVLAEAHTSDWRTWPANLRSPGGHEVPADRVRFHSWLQWLLDRQLERAAGELRPICDLAIGADPGGADAWTWQDQLIPGYTVGAPPDVMNLSGQDWGFPAFHPGALVSSRFQPFREIVRANLRHAFGLRIDHVMGLFRLWLIPAGGSPADGAYVTYPAAGMLDVLAEESRAARALVVGEDLGTVAPGVREEMERRRILSYRLLLFEDRSPAKYPALSLGAVTTHDLPTVAGLWTGADATAVTQAGLEPNLAANEQLRQRLARLGGVARDASAEAAILAVYTALGRGNS